MLKETTMNLQCTMFESTWNLWTIYKTQTETNRLTEPTDQQEKQARNLAWVQTMIQNQCKLKKGKCKPVTDRKQTGKDKSQDPDHWSGLRHFNQEPKQTKSFRMQTGNNSSKQTQWLSESTKMWSPEAIKQTIQHS